MSKTSEGLEPHLYFPIFGVDREIPPDEPGMECPHKTVLMTKLNDESSRSHAIFIINLTKIMQTDKHGAR